MYTVCESYLIICPLSDVYAMKIYQEASMSGQSIPQSVLWDELSACSQIVWPQVDVASRFTVQSCPNAACASPSTVPGGPTALCPTCGQWLLSYTPPGRR